MCVGSKDGKARYGIGRPCLLNLLIEKGGDTVEEGAVLRPGAHEWLFKATGDGRHHLKKSDHGPKN